MRCASSTRHTSPIGCRSSRAKKISREDSASAWQKRSGADPESQFKTLVCVSPTRDHVVCCIPVAEELDLKKAAAAAGEKSLELMPIKQLESVTGYVRGGCTPVGMKKKFPTLIDETAELFDEIGISGGKRGVGLIVAPEPLAKFLDARFVDIVQEGR
jgi:Cys-tRNA(Pro)/Cys-tRNA(Cys) deacylase